jgi:hypothetical protein
MNICDKRINYPAAPLKRDLHIAPASGWDIKKHNQFYGYAKSISDIFSAPDVLLIST